MESFGENIFCWPFQGANIQGPRGLEQIPVFSPGPPKSVADVTGLWDGIRHHTCRWVSIDDSESFLGLVDMSQTSNGVFGTLEIILVLLMHFWAFLGVLFFFLGVFWTCLDHLWQFTAYDFLRFPDGKVSRLPRFKGVGRDCPKHGAKTDKKRASTTRQEMFTMFYLSCWQMFNLRCNNRGCLKRVR